MENNIDKILGIIKKHTEEYHQQYEQSFTEKSRLDARSSLLFLKILVLQRFYDLEFDGLYYLLVDRTSFKNFLNNENLPSIETVIGYKKALQSNQFLEDAFQEMDYGLYDKGSKIKKGRYQELFVEHISDSKDTKKEEPGSVSEIYLEDYAYPLFLRTGTTDSDVYAEVMLQEMYRLSLNFTPVFIIDCGANIGLTSVFFKKKYPKSLVISVEPELSNYAILEKNTYPYLPGIIPIQGAIWNRKTELNLYNGPCKGHWGFMVDEVTDAEFGKIRTFTLEEIMGKYNRETIDVLKIDIEGAEKELFESGYEYWLPRTKVLLIEIHDGLKEGCSKAVFSALSHYNFKMDMRGNTLIFTKL